ncbi:DEAD/DEAH box helicase family protein [Pontibacter silvestris]|uniref:DEAD/DEAH box helicase family protein n=1 Tax=Pontibacter silvestris TaxID=2305183 RepID=A0ABW4X0N6_9BACT|nr:DEAD/DEAH box helicase family protein [Pontibacter silvestris]MCC9138705.1 DEAD/DEAH box helicase family protein [Pontibacter silvestris]
MMEAQEYIDKTILSLRDFQQETVNYILEQFFGQGKNKILIADEVGLGKTIVSKGVVAKMFERHLETYGPLKDFGVIYICSNQAIAKQNIGKLNFFSGEEAENIVDYSTEDDRITALAYEPKAITSRFKIRIKAFTPATSFDQNSTAGRSDERVLLFRLLFDHPELRGKTNSLKWFLKGTRRMNESNWDKVIEDAKLVEKGKHQKHFHLGTYRQIRQGIKNKFNKKLEKKLPLKDYKQIYDALGLNTPCSLIQVIAAICSKRITSINYYEKSKIFWPLISFLRLKLSECCKDYLIADLFILDEFQRYNQLLNTQETENPGVELARQILNNTEARVLLLSATPFKPYTNDFDELHGESHFKEFDKVLKFLLQDESTSFWSEFDENRKRFFNYIRHPEKIKESSSELALTKQAIESTYHSVIARTERMIVSKEKDAMINSTVKHLEIKKEDIKDFVAFDQIIQMLNSKHDSRLPIPIEYSKSSPYPLSFLANYQHKKKLEQHYNSDAALQKVVKATKDAWLDLKVIRNYQPLFPKKSNSIPNPKARLLVEETIGDDGWKYLWIPPSIPYYPFGGMFRKAKGYTKSLIFSSWKMVPRMISTVVSYEAERLSVGKYIEQNKSKHTSYFDKRRYPFPLLNFKTSKETDELLSMNNFLLNYPSAFLSSLYDPQSNLWENKSVAAIKNHLKQEIKRSLLQLNIMRIGKEGGDWQKWSWYSLFLLDKYHADVDLMKDWLASHQDTVDIDSNDPDEKGGTAKTIYLQEVTQILSGGSAPNVSRLTIIQLDNICEFLADLCLGSPAVCSVRALNKLFNERNSSTFSNSYLVAAGFISLYNKPESIAIIQSTKEDVDYYRKVLVYNIDANIQSMLDEYFYLLKDSNSISTATELAKIVSEILSIRPSLLDVSTISNLGKVKDKEKNRIRTHFALDFGEQKLSSAKANRQINIREAFNSPFRPFVLASTSIGQEGLDFHFYCKKIIHWNLPGNPIDFEQREGRIHRYKGHVIRLNIVEKYLSKLKEQPIQAGLVWDTLLDIASEIEKPLADFHCDLVPCWHVEPVNGITIDRIVPLYPFSKDIDKFYNMLKVLAYYRFTFGQPRQEELIQVIQNFDDPAAIQELMINLSPICNKKIVTQLC